MLEGLEYRLAVPVEEYRRWERLLDGLKAAAKTSKANKRRKLDVGESQAPSSDYTPPWPTRYASSVPTPSPITDRPMAALPSRAGSTLSQSRSKLADGLQSRNSLSSTSTSPLVSRPRKRSFQDEISPQPITQSFVFPPRPQYSQAYPVGGSFLAQPMISPVISAQPDHLAFYSLAAGQRHGIEHQMHPQIYLPPVQARSSSASRPSSSSMSSQPSYVQQQYQVHQQQSVQPPFPSRSSLSLSPMELRRRSSQPSMNFTLPASVPAGIARSPFHFNLPSPDLLSQPMQYASLGLPGASVYFSQFANAVSP